MQRYATRAAGALALAMVFGSAAAWSAAAVRDDRDAAADRKDQPAEAARNEPTRNEPTAEAARDTQQLDAATPGDAASAVSGALSPDQNVQAIWKEQEISFYFQSFTTFYSCSALESRLERILTALGAQQPRVRVRSADCPDRVARTPRVVINAAMPVEATPEAIAEAEKGRSTRELVARVRGERALDLTEPFPAQWRRVSLSRGQLNLEPGDCELIDELRRKVLPKLAVRIVQDDMHCSPHQLTLGQPRLVLDALMKAPEPDDPLRSGGNGR